MKFVAQKMLGVLMAGRIHDFKNGIRFKGNLRNSKIEMWVDIVHEHSFDLSETGLMEALKYKKIFDSLAIGYGINPN